MTNLAQLSIGALTQLMADGNQDPRIAKEIIREFVRRRKPVTGLIDRMLEGWVFCAVDDLYLGFLELFKEFWPDEDDEEMAEKEFHSYIRNWVNGMRTECSIGQKPKWPWPMTEVKPSRPTNGIYFDHQVSALGRLGYHVGTSKGLRDKERKYFLKYFFTQELPREIKEEFGQDYGEPRSEERLKKMANVLASQCRLFKRNDPERYRVAIDHYEMDLAYLKKRFYDQFHTFEWPATEECALV